MSKPVKILLLEDVDSDVFLIERQLKKENLEFILEVVNNKSDFQKSLNSRTPHIILSDYHLPDINGLEALSLLRKKNKNIPFIIVTGALDEETAVSCIKAGADAEIEQEINRAREHLRQEVVTLAISGAEKVLKREVDKEAHASSLNELATQL